MTPTFAQALLVEMALAAGWYALLLIPPKTREVLIGDGFNWIIGGLILTVAFVGLIAMREALKIRRNLVSVMVVGCASPLVGLLLLSFIAWGIWGREPFGTFIVEARDILGNGIASTWYVIFPGGLVTAVLLSKTLPKTSA
jgi:hypothetical protein